MEWKLADGCPLPHTAENVEIQLEKNPGFKLFQILTQPEMVQHKSDIMQPGKQQTVMITMAYPLLCKEVE